MMLFPMGNLGNDSTGTLCTTGLSYKFWEPNNGCDSKPIYSTLKTTFENQTILARKKAEPFLTINYRYENIWDKEYKQIEHFVDKMDGELSSFYVPDLKSGETPSNIVDGGATWTVSIGRTRIYSSVANQRADYAMAWDGSNFRIGAISTVTGGTSIVMGETYGDLTAVNAKKGLVYPLYRCYFATNPLPDFKSGVFINDTVATSEFGGYMWSGEISFSSKYKI